ncbi:SRPBCC domain-containing protein [uncultured Psychroserpens sp.]|uniref:SRPBCC family protein n=1 Tax=uncultured Psychroserpens sp. TaxID=255436 RepID=UPI002609D30A|nr:SRPBCC domain-containing protein [uncultured Psychroserpens sp.]
MEHSPLILEQEFKAPLERVWRAISEVELMKKWYFDIPEFKAEVGCKFQFEGGEENKRYMHLCEVLEVVPLKKLKYSWRYEGYPGISFVTFELSEHGESTKVKLTHEGIESFTNPDFKQEKFEGGWKYLIHESLKGYLEEGKALRYW